jgi:hypothetical protein
MRFRLAAVPYAAMAALSILFALRVAVAAAATDPFELLNSVPAAPANVAAAAAAAQVRSDGGLIVPACEALKTRISAALTPSGTVAGIDLARASSDPAYAAQIQARMQSMSMAEKMAMARASQQAAAGDPAATAAIVGFIGGQRSADVLAQQKMRGLLDGALTAAGAKHRATDAALTAAAKACPTDKTGWPLESCTSALGAKSIAQHRAIEEAALASEGQALTQARALALSELNKGRDLLAHASGPAAASLLAWAMAYVQILDDYSQAIALRAGFWAHADSSKFTGAVSSYIRSPGGEISWPLKDPAYGSAVGTGL